MSLGGTVQANDDGSTTVWFGLTAPGAGNPTNWVHTVPGKSWFTILRLNGPLQAWFDKNLAAPRDRTRHLSPAGRWAGRRFGRGWASRRRRPGPAVYAIVRAAAI